MSVGSANSAKGEERRDAIQVEARRALLNEGYSGVSLRQIATRLGISVGNLQYYFPTKDDLVEAVITKETQVSLSILDDIDWDFQNPGPCLHAAARALLRHHASDAGRFYAIAEALALYDPRYSRLKLRGYLYVFRNVEELVTQIVPELEADQRTRLTRVLVALVDGASLQIQFGRVSDTIGGVDALAHDVAVATERLLENWT